MPAKNKPKRLDRNRSWRVARRKRDLAKVAAGSGRNRKPRPKHKGIVAVEKVVESIKKVVAPEKKVIKKVVKKVVGEVSKKE